MESLERHRGFYGEYLVKSVGGSDVRLIEAFATVPRERYLGPGPWQVCVAGSYLASPTSDPTFLCQNIMVGILPDLGINTGEPALHALCMSACAPQVGDVVLHVGAGTGYFTAILASLVGASGRVWAFEIQPDLFRRARTNLADHGSVSVSAKSGADGPLPSANVVYVSAGATHPAPAWLDALTIGGRLVVPLTPDHQVGCLLLVVRMAVDAYAASVLTFARFIGCEGARKDSESSELLRAMGAGPATAVRSLRRDRSPDETAWCVGDGWWLSTDPATTAR
jgi:protein-L-isoaspartate(D-aspartate) O-methyltransferase